MVTRSILPTTDLRTFLVLDDGFVVADNFLEATATRPRTKVFAG